MQFSSNQVIYFRVISAIFLKKSVLEGTEWPKIWSEGGVVFLSGTVQNMLVCLKEEQ
jgi:hypothetical protein